MDILFFDMKILLVLIYLCDLFPYSTLLFLAFTIVIIHLVSVFKIFIIDFA